MKTVLNHLVSRRPWRVLAGAFEMKSWIIGASALLIGNAAQGEIGSAWLSYPLPDGAELRYVPLAVTLEDYPKQALRAGAEGTTILDLQVDTSGHLIACTTARSSGFPLLDEQACLLYMKRGRFELRGTSNPVRVKAPVKWVLAD